MPPKKSRSRPPRRQPATPTLPADARELGEQLAVFFTDPRNRLVKDTYKNDIATYKAWHPLSPTPRRDEDMQRNLHDYPYRVRMLNQLIQAIEQAMASFNAPGRILGEREEADTSEDVNEEAGATPAAMEWEYRCLAAIRLTMFMFLEAGAALYHVGDSSMVLLKHGTAMLIPPAKPAKLRQVCDQIRSTAEYVITFRDFLQAIVAHGAGVLGRFYQKKDRRGQSPHDRTFLAPLLVNDNHSEVLSIGHAAKNVYDWCTYGAKINILVSEFGPGCIFPLAKFLSQDFLKTKITGTGPYYEEAIRGPVEASFHRKPASWSSI
ncbi:hypothetical protein N0V83_001361 [Neocucurbitaria cava]|uniref:Uncharacterized protein n=1 Tax=Neocucurbitaria cava TaxID=798079 RepID=A0A9W8YF45_9PLEO|nr:hypothetical protein N0V83_001361 [Neocucurbitaria cava]